MTSIFLLIVVAFSCSSATSGQSNAKRAPDSRLVVQKARAQGSFLELLKFTVAVDEHEWSNGRRRYATLHFENSSDRDIEMRGPGTFHLYKRHSKNVRDRFYSSSALPGSTTTTSTPTGEHTVRRTWIKCAKGGHLDLRIDLAALKWGRVIGAESPNQAFFQVIPPGNYELGFIFIVGQSMNGEILESAMFESNKVTVPVR